MAASLLGVLIGTHLSWLAHCHFYQEIMHIVFMIRTEGYFLPLGRVAPPGCSPFAQLAVLIILPFVIDLSRLPESPSGRVRTQVIPRYILPITGFTYPVSPSPPHVEMCTHLHMMQAHTGRPRLNTTFFSQ